MRGNKRRMVSLKICFLSWVYELVGMTTILLRPALGNYGFHNLQFADALVMFVIIPFSHLINDEETKAIIAEEGWYQGLRQMMGIYQEKVTQ